LPGTAWNLRAFSGWYLLEMLVRLMELAGMFVLYDTLMEWVKWNSRALNAEEMVLARRAFGDSIRLDLVRVDAMAFSTRITRERFAYVGFHTVNFWKEVNTSELVHELVHVWHYEQMGAAYTVRALRAQRSKEGYNYGGVGISIWSSRRRSSWTVSACRWAGSRPGGTLKRKIWTFTARFCGHFSPSRKERIGSLR
jgi:hypothetical protein